MWLSVEVRMPARACSASFPRVVEQETRALLFNKSVAVCRIVVRRNPAHICLTQRTRYTIVEEGAQVTRAPLPNKILTYSCTCHDAQQPRANLLLKIPVTEDVSVFTV